jgi:potassium/hydrogen antiporter
MDRLADFFPDLLLVSALLLVAIGLAPLASRVGFPGPAAFLAVGIVAGLLDALPTDELGAVALEEIGAIALYAILFQGGLSTGFHSWRADARPILLLGLPGTAATAAAVCALAHYALGLDWALASFIGIALAPTDPAAVYAVLRAGSERSRARTVLEGESGFNDPVGITLMAIAVEYVADPGTTVTDGAVRLLQELLIGLTGGTVGALVLLLVLKGTPRLEEALQGAAVLLTAVVVGAATATLHGSGFLAVYVAGLLTADRWAAHEGRHHAVPEAASAIAEPALFGLLGASFASLVGTTELWHGIVLTLVTVLVVRPLVASACLLESALSRTERAVVSWGGLKGAVPLLLAAYPALEGLAESPTTKAIVLVATAASILVQGTTLRLVTARTAH